MQRYDWTGGVGMAEYDHGMYVHADEALARIAELEQRVAGLRNMIANGNAVPVIRFNADNDWILTKRAERAEQREQQAWLAAWDAEWWAQQQQRRAFVNVLVAMHARADAQDALLRRAEEALMRADDALSYLGHANSGGCSEVAATLAAIREQREGEPPQQYGCHVDLEPGMEPDECVLDTGQVGKCVHAIRLQANGRGKRDCEYWKPVRR